MKFDAEEFYPTPKKLLDKVTLGIDWKKVNTVLEPSAGKGDIAAYVTEKAKLDWNNALDVDCIEIDQDLAATLKGKEFKVVHDDFLTFHTYKRYDLIIMNPPFSSGSRHLVKALDMQKDGGAVICILNAETLKNPCTNERVTLIKHLNELSADIEYLAGEFASAERPTGVEIAVIKVCIPEKEQDSFIFESTKNLHKKAFGETSYSNITDLAPNDFIEAIVAMYNIEVDSGIKLIQEYQAMCPHLLDDLREDSVYKKPIIEMKLQNKSLSTNEFVKEVRRKYWTALFHNRKFTGQMTYNLSKKYFDQVAELVNYDFSMYNIKCIQEEMSRNLIKGIEDCIIELFDQLSYQYSYSRELEHNIHYYNGWCTNKAWIINKKVILPFMNAFSSWNSRFEPRYDVRTKLSDIEKALNYLDGGLTDSLDMDRILNNAEKTGQTKKIKLKYFYVTFYKKGTCHIEFTNEDLLKKLNIFGSQQKRWLPPGYGRKRYGEFTPEERVVIDEFEGKESYQDTIIRSDYYIYNPKTSLPLIGAVEAA